MKSLTNVTLLKVQVGQGHIFKAAWWGLRDGRRRRFTETIGPVGQITRKDAKLFCAQKQDAMNAGRISPDRLGRMGLADFLERDVKAAALDLKPSSINNLINAGNHAVAALGEDFNVQKVDSAAVVRIREHLQGKGLAKPTVSKCLSFLQGACRRGVERGILHANPFNGIKHPKFQTGRPKTFTPAEVDAMIGVCRDRSDLWWESFIRLGATSGCRRGEMVHLLWTSIDWEGTVTINPQKGGTFTVGGETYPLLAWESKDYETRVLPLPPETLATLGRLRAKAALRAEHGPGPYVFLDLTRLKHIRKHIADNGGTLNPNYAVIPNLGRHFGEIQDQAKDALRGHDWLPGRSIKHLRRTYASRLSEHVSSFQLKTLLGHSSVTTTEKHYVASSGDLGRKIQAAFAEGGAA